MKRYICREPARRDKPDDGSGCKISAADAQTDCGAERPYLSYELSGKGFCRPDGGDRAKIREHMKRVREEAVHEQAKETRDR